MARHDGPEHPVFTRVAQRDHAIYVDLANPKGQAVKITADHWSIVRNPKVRFVRPKGMLPLPRPVLGGSVNELFDCINLPRRDHQVLLTGCLVNAFRPSNGQPLIEFQGLQGSGKSIAMRATRAVVDPNTAPIRGQPREERDLMIAAHNGWVLAFDNLSRLPRWLSDAFCRLATGGGFATRQLYADLEEVIIDAKRSVMVTGIEPLSIRGDLLDRTVTLELPEISSEGRRTEEALWQEFDTATPRILGALCDAVSCALRNIKSVNLPSRSRMADFETWVTAAEDALGWAPGTFHQAYARNRRTAKRRAAERDPHVRQRLAVGIHYRNRTRHGGCHDDVERLLMALLTYAVPTERMLGVSCEHDVLVLFVGVGDGLCEYDGICKRIGSIVLGDGLFDDFVSVSPVIHVMNENDLSARDRLSLLRENAPHHFDCALIDREILPG